MLKFSPYEVLGLEGNFTYKEIKKAYRKAIRENPPEKFPERFAEISDAYDSLVHEEYFFKNVDNNLHVFDISLDIEEDTLDTSRYLKDIFEVPFILMKDDA